MKDLSWGKIAGIVIGIFLSVILAEWSTNAYIRGSNFSDIEHLELEMNSKVDNAVLLEYMHATSEKFNYVQLRLGDHIKIHDDKNRALEERIIRLENKYLVEPFRSVEKKKITYYRLQNYLWTNGDYDYLADYLSSIPCNKYEK